MNQQRRSGIPGPVLAGMLGIIMVLLVVIGVGARFLIARSAVEPQSSIFNQTPSAGTNQPLSAQNLSHLHPVWAYTLPTYALSKMAIADGTMYITILTGTYPSVAAIRNGSQLWRHQMPDPSSYIFGMQVGGDAVFLATNSDVYAVSAATGQVRWHYPAERIFQFANADSAFVYADATLYLGTNDQVIALDAATGTPRWSYRFTDDPTSAYSPFAPSLAVGAGNLYLFLTTSPYVAGAAATALDLRTGAVRWRLQETDASTLATPQPIAGDNGIIYRVVGQSVSALDDSTGAMVWTVPVDESEGRHPTGMSLDAQHLYIAGSGWIQAFDRETGQLAWSNEQLAASRVLTGPLASNGVVYIATVTPFTGYGHPLFFGPPARSPHWLYAFNASSGSILRMLQDNDSSFEPSIIRADDTHLYVGGTRSFVAADQAASGQPNIYALGV